jgi:hypothetical protein
VLHPLETDIDREVATTTQAPESLNVSALVVPQTALDYLRRLAIQACIDRNRLKHNILAHMSAYLEAELYRPNVFAFDFAVDVVWATATPTILPTIDDRIESVP